MYPNLFGIDGFSMVVMIFVGVIAASLLFFIYLHHVGVDRKHNLDLVIVIIITAFMGIVFAILFENLYEAIKASSLGAVPHWTWGMTFYGGLLGGVATFILMYRYFYLKNNPPIFDKILIIAPSSIALGHAFGRIGCYLSGCCYGIETHSSWDIYFPVHEHAYLPTQLIEMTYLFILAAVLALLAFKKITPYTFPIYMVSYGVFRFIIEFFRGDERGQLAGLSPSQYWCIALVVLAFPVTILLKKKFFLEKDNAI